MNEKNYYYFCEDCRHYVASILGLKIKLRKLTCSQSQDGQYKCVKDFKEGYSCFKQDKE